MKTDNHKFHGIMYNHVTVLDWDDTFEIDPLSFFDTTELVELVRLLDAELQNRDLPTAQEQWENEGGGGVGVG